MDQKLLLGDYSHLTEKCELSVNLVQSSSSTESCTYTQLQVIQGQKVPTMQKQSSNLWGF